ncbi:MAG: chemotaxis protein CheB [Bdellovibrionota bacterium]
MVVLGCSAGGIEALKTILTSLPKTFGYAIAIVQHVAGDSNTLADFFGQICHCPIIEVEDKQPIIPGNIFIAPAGYHLMVEDKKYFSLSVEEPVRFSRPSIDVLFETAAQVYKSKTVGIVLTGANEDGADGLKQIKNQGGLAVVQDPKTAKFPAMPEAAINEASPQYILKLEEISQFLDSLG